MNWLEALAHADTDGASFHAWRSYKANWLPLVEEIASAHGLPIREVAAFKTGTNLVVALDGGTVLKVFPPSTHRQFLSECASLHDISGRLSVDTPTLMMEGEWHGWTYMVISRLDGTVGSEIWPHLDNQDKAVILCQIGELIREVQGTPLNKVLALEPKWPDFIAGQRAAYLARHQKLGLGEPLLSQLPEFIAQSNDLIPSNAPHVLLTGEYIPENLMLSQKNGQWRLSGLFDFGDVMSGFRDYDLLGPSAFMAAGEPLLMRKLLQGFGYERADSGLLNRLMFLHILHKHSDFNKIAIEDWRLKARTLTDLAKLIWQTE